MFKVGDLIKGRKNNGYRVTNEKMKKAEVVNINKYVMEMKILEHSSKEEIGETYTVSNHKLNEKFKLYETVFERKEEILDEVEKKYLGNVVRPFREEVCSIKKMKSAEQYRIKIVTRNGNIILPHFQKNEMYVNMQEEKDYKLEELGL